MKIRSDFVANSSSYSSTIIRIDNPLLLEILQRYRELGVFGDEAPRFAIGHPPEDYYGADEDWSDTPAFYLDEMDALELFYIPKPESLGQVLSAVISIIDCDNRNYDGDLFSRMKAELKDKEDAILKSFDRVIIEDRETTNERDFEDEHGEIFEGEVTEFKRFYFDRKIGEEYHYIIEGNDKKMETLIINGKKIK